MKLKSGMVLVTILVGLFAFSAAGLMVTYYKYYGAGAQTQSAERKLDAVEKELQETRELLKQKDAELEEKDQAYFELFMEWFAAQGEVNSLQSKIEALETLLAERNPVAENADSPWQAYHNGFLSSMFGGDAKGTWEYLSSKDKGRCSREAFEVYFSLYIFGDSQPSPPPTYMFVEEFVSGDKTLAVVVFITDSGRLSTATLFSEDGKWRVAPLELSC